MADILGNNSLYINPFLNLTSNSQLEAMQAKISTAQAEVTRITTELRKCTDKYNYCKSHGALWSCKANTGKTESTWKWYVDSYTGELKTAKSVLANAQKAYNDALASNKAESEAGKSESEMDTETAREWGEKGKTFGTWGLVVLILGFGGVIAYKKFIKK